MNNGVSNTFNTPPPKGADNTRSGEGLGSLRNRTVRTSRTPDQAIERQEPSSAQFRTPPLTERRVELYDRPSQIASSVDSLPATDRVEGFELGLVAVPIDDVQSCTNFVLPENIESDSVMPDLALPENIESTPAHSGRMESRLISERFTTKQLVERVRSHGAVGVINELCSWNVNSYNASDVVRVVYDPPESKMIKLGDQEVWQTELKSQDNQPFSYYAEPYGLDMKPRLQLLGMLIAVDDYHAKYGVDIKFVNTGNIQSAQAHEPIKALVGALKSHLDSSLSVGESLGLIVPSSIGLTLEAGHAVPLLVRRIEQGSLEVINLDSTPIHLDVDFPPALNENSHEIRSLSADEKEVAILERKKEISELKTLVERHVGTYWPRLLADNLGERYGEVLYSELSTIRQADDIGCMTDAIVILKEALRNDGDDPNPSYQNLQDVSGPKLKPSMLKTSQRSKFWRSQAEDGSSIFSQKKSRSLTEHKKNHSIREPSYKVYNAIDASKQDSVVQTLKSLHGDKNVSTTAYGILTTESPISLNRFIRIKTMKLASTAMFKIQEQGIDALPYLDNLKNSKIISAFC